MRKRSRVFRNIKQETMKHFIFITLIFLLFLFWRGTTPKFPNMIPEPEPEPATETPTNSSGSHYRTGSAKGYYSILKTKSGHYNIGIGYKAGYKIKKEDKNAKY